MEQYFKVKNKYMADALSFLSDDFRYYTFDDLETGKKIYSFKNSEKLQKAVDFLLKYKKELNIK